MSPLPDFLANLRPPADNADPSSVDIFGAVRNLHSAVDGFISPYFSEFRDKVVGLVDDFTTSTPPEVPRIVATIRDAVLDGMQQRIGDILQGAIGTMADGFFASLGTFLTTHFGGGAKPDLDPVEADQIVHQIAAAVTAAEKTLNQQGLVISQGTVELDVFLKPVGSTASNAGARARLVFNITPRV
ncbi:MAG TPA: hypothetical protein VM261_35845 [Kofleriaceae bacterium]|nr:hypothetical protein [Kofleriaceae bacterium]